MAYVVLARKYRPQRFADLVGQEHVTRTLANAIAHDRVHHAYLFCGARGLGKTTAARLLAKCLVCVKGPTIDPCNECSECVAVTEGRSVDVIEIDGASNNRVEDVRNIREQVRYLPQTARRKIYIIDEVHMLTGSAFNALLKTLEEPPAHVTFIFATTEVHELPATILSRVSRFDFRRLSSSQLVGHLKSILAREGVAVEEAGLYTVARAGDGSVRDSLTLLDKVIAFASDTGKVGAEEVRVVLGVPSTLAVAGLVEAVLARDATLTLRRFDEIFTSGQDLLALALELLKHLRDLTVVKLCGSRDVLLDASDQEFEQLTRQAAEVDATVLSQLFDRFTRVVDALPRTRVPRLVLEMGLLDLVHADPLVPLGDLIDRLEQISAHGPSGGGGGGSAPAGGGRQGGSRPGGFEPPPRPEPARRATSGANPNNLESFLASLPNPASPSPTPAGPPTRASAPASRPGEPPRAAEPWSRPAESPRPAESSPHPAEPRSRPTEPWSHAPGSSPPPAEARSRPAEPWSHAPGASPPPAEPRSRPVEPWSHAPGASPPPAEPSPRPAEPSPPPAEPSPPPAEPSPPPAEPWSRAPASAAVAPDPALPPRSRDSHANPERPRPAEAPRASAHADSSPAAAAPDDACGACPATREAPSHTAIAWASLPPFAAWEQFLDRMRGEMGVFAVLAEFGVVGVGDGVVRLVGSNYYRDMLQPHRGLIDQSLHLHMGAPFRLELIEGEPSLAEAPSLRLVERQRMEALQAEVAQEARTHPHIRALLAQFDGQLKQVRPLVAPTPK